MLAALLLACSEPFVAASGGPEFRGESAGGAADDAADDAAGDAAGDAIGDTAGDAAGDADPAGEGTGDTALLELFLAVDGDDAAAGTDPSAPLASLNGVVARLAELSPAGPVEVRVAPGAYPCRGLAEPWTFANGQRVRIASLDDVPAPAKESADDPNRPVFEGRDESGALCADSVWMNVQHDGTPLNLTVEGIAITRYRGGLSVKAADGVEADPDLGLEVLNVVFERIGDKYHYREREDGSWLAGKGAVLLSRASGGRFVGNYFHHVRNVEGSAGLVHALYLASHASRHWVEGNTVHGVTGAIVKLSDFSNENVFVDNHFSYGQLAVRDRWCGALEDPDDACGGEAQCPSWDNVFPMERNTWGNLEGDDPVRVLDIPDGQTCPEAPSPSGVRMDLGEGGVILGS